MSRRRRAQGPLAVAVAMVAMVAIAVTVIAVTTVSPVAAIDDLPPVLVPGVRVVDLRTTSGTLERHYSIPSTSQFAREGDGGMCEFVAATNGTTSDGQPYVRGQTVRSDRWIFIEGQLPTFDGGTILEPADALPLEDVVRYFVVFCDSTAHPIAAITVRNRDPMIDPRRRLDTLRDTLQLVRPVVYTNPVVVRWGGLITRYPSWLAVLPLAWRTQRSSTVTWRGWTMSLVARPIVLDFVVTFRPDPSRPSPSFSGVVACIPEGTIPTIGVASVPAMPQLAVQTAPGVNGRCTWTPPGPGSVTIEARLTYEVVFWANGYYEVQPDYRWSSVPAVFATGELAAVNVLR